MITITPHLQVFDRLYDIIHLLNISKIVKNIYYLDDKYFYNIDKNDNYFYNDNIFKNLNIIYNNKYLLNNDMIIQNFLSTDDIIIYTNKNIQNITYNFFYFNNFYDDDCINFIIENKNKNIILYTYDKDYYFIPKNFDKIFYNRFFINNDILNSYVYPKYNNYLKNSICLFINKNYDIFYYYKSIKEIEKHKHIDNILVISDDYDWCSMYLLDPRLVFVQDLDYIQFYVATLCENYIITNESILLISLFLNLNNNIIITTPSNFKNKNYLNNFKNLIIE
jgi:hypothetical protein